MVYMKLVVVGFYHDSYLCAVPDEVADNLWDCCLEFLDWLHESRDYFTNENHRKKYKQRYSAGPSVETFIVYLNEVKYPEYESTIRGRYEDMKKTKRIENLPYFWF